MPAKDSTLGARTECPTTLQAIDALSRRAYYARHTLKLGTGALNQHLHDANDRADVSLSSAFVDELSYVVSQAAA